MLYNVRQPYTPALELYEFNDRSLIIDTETVGKGAEIEVVEIALGDCEGRIIYHSLMRPTFNPPAPLDERAALRRGGV